jgi:ectoine hydroxylase-related dioxygenase (phytanoyl-CoA dioxygenase family)
MDDVRTTPLTDAELERYELDGYLSPLRLLSTGDAAELRQAIEDHVSGRLESERYELMDPVVVRQVNGTDGEAVFEYDESANSEKTHTFPFLFNLWKWDERFRRVGMNPVIAGIARQLLGAEQVLLMEDNAIVKQPHSKVIPWHQDYSYWPLEKPAAVTVWIALDPVDESNGGMQIAPGTHNTGEHLPVMFADAKTFMDEARRLPAVPQDPGAEGHKVITYNLRPGEGGYHHPMVWHGSPPNVTDKPRVALALRYVTAGSTWLGNTRIPYDDIGCKVGDRLQPGHFPLVETAF